MSHEDGEQEQSGSRRGLSRRSLLQGSGTGLAAVAIVGLGSQTAASASQATGPAAKPARGPLRAADPHGGTRRTKAPRAAATLASSGTAQVRILPIDRAKFLAGGRFDLRVEAAGVDPETARIHIAVTGPGGRPAPILVGEPERTSMANDSLEVTYRGLSYPDPGDYTVTATVTSDDGRSEAEVGHEVVLAKSGGGRAKNVIFFLGDGMGAAAITAARILSKGITEGKYHGLLEMDRMDFRGLVTTSGVDALAPDSAHTMAAYMTGHKSSVNALGVYESNDPDPNTHPRVETMAELVRRARGMKFGVVTTANIQDATPAATFAHTRSRGEYLEIMDQALEPVRTPDVLMGGGLAWLLPQSESGSRRKDERNLVEEFKDQGFQCAQSRTQLAKIVSNGPPEKLLGQFHPEVMNFYIDRQHTRKPEVLGEWDDQPTLVEMTEAALTTLEGSRNGFFLVVEGASIDKMSHVMDGPRAVYETIEFDQAIGAAKKWAEGRNDTLIVVTADHNHAMSVVGTHDRREGAGRAGNGVYGDATYPTYVDSDGDGFPDDPSPDVQLFFGWSNHPDHTDDFEHNDTWSLPAMLDQSGRAVDNPDHDPGAELQTGNLPFGETTCVHCVDDVSIVASGPGAERFNAVLDNTEVFFAMMDALRIDARGR